MWVMLHAKIMLFHFYFNLPFVVDRGLVPLNQFWFTTMYNRD